MQKLIIPVAILLVLASIAAWVFFNPPQAQRRGPPQGAQTIVEVVDLQPRDYTISVSSYGTVQPRTQSFLVAQISGQIMQVNPSFRPGGFFTTEEVLAVVDPRDYEANVKIAEATLMDALQSRAQEEARSGQAEVDWQRLGKPGEAASDLVLRIPQLQAAQARVSSAESNLTKAQLSLERTRVKAPFDGRILRQLVDLGQVVAGGSQLAEIYATDYVEVRLPIRNADLDYIDLPEGGAHSAIEVTFKSELGSATTWQGQVVRTEGAIDEVSRQLHVVAQINNPFEVTDGIRPLKVGEYVTGELRGKTMVGAIVVPTNTVYQNSYVYVVEEDLLRRREVTIGWQNGAEALVEKGLSAGDRLVMTPLGQVSSGTRVRVAGEQPELPADGRGPRGGIAR
ncbi:MAG: RND family efflux transporter MFP subunit [Candidatus Azotimanducaceae bacterium]